ncbi:hypothetical protein ES703_31792 [subsurface metagenome]
MAGMRVGDVILKNLQKKAAKLVSVAELLTILFDQEETKLKRKAEVTRLKLLRSAILQRAEQERSTEISASIGYKQRRLIAQSAGLLITALSKNNKVQSVARSLLKEPAGEKHAFGAILIRIDKKGLPDGVDVVHISRLGRESNLSETEVINRLKKDGSLLLSEENFSRLIDKLIEGMLKGYLALPISIQTLSQILTPYPLQSIHQNKG